VANPNPLGAALEAMLGAGAAALTAWQQAIVAAVFELCLVAVMVAFALLGHGGRDLAAGAQAPDDGARPAQKPEAIVDPVAGVPATTALRPPRKARAKAPAAASTVKVFLRDHLFPADNGECTDIMAMVRSYRTRCTEKGLAPAALDAILDQIEQLCGKVGVKIEPDNDQRVYVHGVRIEAPPPVSVH
jgi:hypothetical protein